MVNLKENKNSQTRLEVTIFFKIIKFQTTVEISNHNNIQVQIQEKQSKSEYTNM